MIKRAAALIIALAVILLATAFADTQYDYTSEYKFGMAVAYDRDMNGFVLDEDKNVIFSPGQVASISISGENLIVVLYSYDTNAQSAVYYERIDGEFKEVTAVNTNFDMTKYYPNEGELVARLDGDVTLARIPAPSQRIPRVDGATALFPMYSAFVQAAYPSQTRFEPVWVNSDALITCTKTNYAYERLISGEADIIFVAGPSDAQIAQAAEAGVKFRLTPIGKEAFVFIVNMDNPIEEITLEQIRGIYSGQITDWSELGYPEMGKIIPYQRPANSGSQTALERLMEGYELMPAPEDYVAYDMSTVLDVVEYQNFPNAIGYSFRFFVTDLMGSEVKLLKIDGVEPTVENITSGTYPLTTQLYAVTREGDFNLNLAVFLAWVQSEQGMELVEKSGYVPEY